MLPETLERRAVERLRWLVLAFAIVFLAGIPLRWLGWRPDDDLLFYLGSIVSAVLAGLGFIAFAVLRFGDLEARLVLALGLGYEVLLCFALAMVEQIVVGFAPMPFRLSSVALVLLTFPLIVPSPPRWRLLTTVAAAVAQPIALGVVALLADGQLHFRALVAACAPTFVVAGLAAWLSQVIHRLRLDVEHGASFGQYELVERVREVAADLPRWSGERAETWWEEHLPDLARAKTQLVL